MLILPLQASHRLSRPMPQCRTLDCNVLNAAIAPYLARVSKDSPSNASNDPLFTAANTAMAAEATRTAPMEIVRVRSPPPPPHPPTPSLSQSVPPSRPQTNQHPPTTPPHCAVIVPDHRRESRDSVREPRAAA
jgi:hypothetical protein